MAASLRSKCPPLMAPIILPQYLLCQLDQRKAGSCDRCYSQRQSVEQRLRLFQIGGPEALCEPVVDFGQHRTRLIATTLRIEEPHEAHGRSQLPPLSLLTLCDRDRLAEGFFHLTLRCARPQLEFAL